MRFTKIVCTIGPSCESVSVLKHMVAAGMNVARLNLSHGDHAWHHAAMLKVRSVSNKIAIMLDTKGAEVRTQKLDQPVELKKNEKIVLTTSKGDPEKKIIHQTYAKLPKYVKKGDTILIDDGKIELVVLEKHANDIVCRCASNATLLSRKSIAVPNVYLHLPGMTPQDIEDIHFGIKNNVDFIALSLVKSADDVRKVRSIISKANKEITLIAKIEHPKAVENIDEIIKEADGIMVARGDLGLKISPEKVPMLQKMIIKKTSEAAKPVIVATQMLDSMMNHPTPTRAEVSDVANAILDGADAVMLSGETAAGKFPLHAVRMMAKICDETDPSVLRMHTGQRQETIPEVIAEAVTSAVPKLNIKAIVTPTFSGFTPSILSKRNPGVPIFGLTHDLHLMRKFGIIRGVLQFSPSHKSLLNTAMEYGLQNKLFTMDDLVALAYKHDVSEELHTTNCMEIKVVGEILKSEVYRKKDIAHKHHRQKKS